MRAPALVVAVSVVAASLLGPSAVLHAQGAEPDPAAASKLVLKPSDREQLGELFADYFKLKYEHNDLKKLQAALLKVEADMTKKAKAAKVTTLLESTADMRLLMSAPFLPAKTLKKGLFYEDSTQVELPDGTKGDFKFLYRLPKNYSEKQFYPLVIALAPKIEKLDALKKWSDAAFPEAICETSLIIVPENLKSVEWTSDQGFMTALFPLREVLGKYAVDRGRIFLDAQGDAAPAAVEFITRYPGLFTAATLRESDAAPPTKLLANARYVPLLLVNSAGGESSKIHAQFAQDCIAAGLKTTPCESPVEAAGKAGDAGVAAIVKFVAETAKTFGPRDIKFTTESGASTNAYWLQLSRLEVSSTKPVTVEATIDRVTNEVRITAPPTVTEVIIYLNQDLLDMGKDFKVLVTQKKGENPKTTTAGPFRKTQSLDTTLKCWFENSASDNGEVYTNYVVVSTK